MTMGSGRVDETIQNKVNKKIKKEGHRAIDLREGSLPTLARFENPHWSHLEL